MQVDTNIPLPVKNKWKAPLAKLGIKESFAFDKDDRAAVAVTVSQYFHKETEKRFTISFDPMNEDTKDRVWRTE